MEKIGEIANKIKGDKALQEKFLKDPAGAVESVLGISIPKDQIENVVSAVKAKLGADKLGDAIGAIGGLFGKKN